METNLLELIQENDETISLYLEGVLIKDFKEDVLRIATMNADKESIKKAIEMLSSLL